MQRNGKEGEGTRSRLHIFQISSKFSRVTSIDVISHQSYCYHHVKFLESSINSFKFRSPVPLTPSISSVIAGIAIKFSKVLIILNLWEATARHFDTSCEHLAMKGADRLSSLPDEIQKQILHYLPTIDATRTAILSRTWRTKCYSLERLCFYYNLSSDIPVEREAFENFVNQVLARRDESDVHIFELCIAPSHAYRVPIKNDWIVYPLLHNVQNLVLSGRIHEVQKLPDFLFACKSLMKLELALIDHVLRWPENFELPNLRELCLKFLELSEQGLRHDLFSSLPALEKLSIFLCVVENFKGVSISSANRLKTFIMCNCRGMDGCSISIKASSLTQFIYVGGVRRSDDFDIPRRASKFVANAKFPRAMNVGSELSQSVIEITRELFKASYLEINHPFVWALSTVPHLPRCFASDVFDNMKMLKFYLPPVDYYIKAVMALVCRCPNLTMLRLDIVRGEGQLLGMNDLELNLVNDEGDSHKMIYVNIENFGGNECEMGLVKYLLDNAQLFFTVKIEFDGSIMGNELELKISQLREIGKASRDARVIRGSRMCFISLVDLSLSKLLDMHESLHI